ncbi:fucolectin-like [Ptychodera flava]|uniref:fucolectin-like n=1 Tax=Ptychodera flava TaxID=63121 RepID=UPI00396A107C
MIPTLPPCEYPADLTNVALGKPTSQSSTKKKKDGGPEKAVDGNKDSDLKKGNSCTFTDREYQPRWEVDLEQSFDIYEVVITNRQDCCVQRIKNAEIRVADSENFEENPVCGMMILGKMAKSETITIRCGSETPRRGRYVSIQLIDRGRNLNLCEVEDMAR